MHIKAKTVAKDLRDRSELWDAFVFGRFAWGQLIELRDLPKGHLSADTLYIMTTDDRKKDLQAVKSVMGTGCVQHHPG